jgi:nucleoside-triphosphatase THEP1
MDLTESEARNTITSILKRVNRTSSGRIPKDRIGFLTGLVGSKWKYIVNEVVEKLETQIGGSNCVRVSFKGREYKVRTTASGAKYILVLGDKKYLSSM